MKSLIKQLMSESAIYGISSMLTKLIGIFLVPLYTRLLTPADYGTLNLVNSTFYFIIVLAVFSLDSASARWYYDSEQEEDKKKTIASWFWFQLAASALLAILLCAGSSLLSTLVLKQSEPYLFIIPAIGLIANILPMMVSNWLRFQRKAVHTVVFTIVNLLINVALNIYLVLILKWGVKGILSALLLSNTVASVYVISLMKDWINPVYFSRQRLQEMLKFALPLIPTSIAFWILNSSSSFVIEYFHGKSEVGLYSIGAMLASAVTMVVGSFQMAWGPFAFSIIDQPESKRTYAMVLTLYSMLMSFIALGVSLFAREGLTLLTTAAYEEAYLVAGILAFNAIIYGYAYIATVGTSIVKDNRPLSISIILAALFTGTLYFILVPVFGKEGAALSTLLGYIIVPVFVFYRAQKVWYIPYKFTLSVMVVLLAMVLYMCSLLLPDVGLLFNLLMKSGLLIAYFFLLLILFRFHYPDVLLKWKRN